MTTQMLALNRAGESASRDSLLSTYRRVRRTTVELSDPLSPEDQVVQSMTDASPTKWHLAHASWFFEHFVLVPHLSDYKLFNPAYGYLFNSYYNTVGPMHKRPARGVLSRPSVAKVMDYRAYIDTHMTRLIDKHLDDDAARLVVLGLNHEQQHQELILTDIKHAFSLNPLRPVYSATSGMRKGRKTKIEFIMGARGKQQIGHDGTGFAFDNETPRHDVFVRQHALASRLVTNAEYKEFIDDKGYERPELWLSDGWTVAQEQGWSRPLYWDADLKTEFTLAGKKTLYANTPVSHVSFYEAEAYARWAGMRLPTEAEHELAARPKPVEGNFAEDGVFHPQPALSSGMQQFFGDLWEWTSSSYAPYPGFRPLSGSLGEYNGKFMCNQMVLRGGSCATPKSHIRATYRNFFYPDARWQFTGIRLAKDV